MSLEGEVAASARQTTGPADRAHPEPYVARRHIPGLDVLRGAAIAGVVIYHGVRGAAPTTLTYSGWQRWVVYATSLGWLGVPLFFVLSGFLITEILLGSRDRADYYRRFYVRRALRLLPVYFTMLLLLKATGFISWRFTLACVLYAANMPSLFGTTTEYGPFWSLAVEEQFYLLWPLFVRAFSPRRLLLLALAVCALSPCLRFASAWFFPTRDTFYKTYMIADNLTYGALIAIALRTQKLDLASAKRLARLAFAMGVPLGLLVCVYAEESHHSRLGAALLAALKTWPFIIVFAGLILRAIVRAPEDRARPSPAGLRAILPFLGYISYGLYAVHAWMFMLYDRWFLPGSATHAEPSFAAVTLRCVVCSAVAVGIAYLSKLYLEAPFLAWNPGASYAVADRISAGTRR